MNPIFLIVFLTAYVFFFIRDVRKLKAEGGISARKSLFYLLNLITIMLLIVAALRLPVPMPTEMIDRSAARWAHSILGRISHEEIDR